MDCTWNIPTPSPTPVCQKTVFQENSRGQGRNFQCAQLSQVAGLGRCWSSGVPRGRPSLARGPQKNSDSLGDDRRDLFHFFLISLWDKLKTYQFCYSLPKKKFSFFTDAWGTSYDDHCPNIYHSVADTIDITVLNWTCSIKMMTHLICVQHFPRVGEYNENTPKDAQLVGTFF